MVTLDVSGNGIRESEARELAAALKGNQTMTELNIAHSEMTFVEWKMTNGRYGPVYDTPTAINTLWYAIQSMALRIFTFSGESRYGANYRIPQPATMNTTMKVADFSDRELHIPGGLMATAFLPNCQ
jgi:hypothetical protein